MLLLRDWPTMSLEVAKKFLIAAQAGRGRRRSSLNAPAGSADLKESANAIHDLALDLGHE